METENATCDVCSLPYDSAEHLPRVLVNCGHTLCSFCLKVIFNNPNLRKCPFDNSTLKKSKECLDNFPVNFALLALIEAKSQNACKIHYGEKLIMFCLQHKVKICAHCALFGEHKGHAMKTISELKAHGMKVKKDLEEGLMKFEKNELEKYQEVDLLKKRFLSKMEIKFEEIKDLLKTKELEWRKEIDHLFDESFKNDSKLLLKKEVEKALEEIGQACGKDDDSLAILCQDFSSIISSLQPQKFKEEALKLSEKTSRMMNFIESFLVSQARFFKNFDLLSEMMKLQQFIIKEEEEPEQKQVPSINSKKKAQKSSIIEAKTLLVLLKSEESLFVYVGNPIPTIVTVNFDELKKVKRVNVEFGRLLEPADFKFLSKILHQLSNYTSLAVSFTPEHLNSLGVLNLLSFLFCRIQYLTEVEVSFERCKITDHSISAFINNTLRGAASLKSLTLKLGYTLISDLSLFALAKSLKNLDSFTLGIGHTDITNNGIEKVLCAVLGVKELNLQLQDSLVTDHCFKMLGSHIMPCMKNLERFSLDASETLITMEGVSAVFIGIPKEIKWLNLGFSQVEFSDKVVSLFEEKVEPKLELVEDVNVRFGETEMPKSLRLIKKMTDNRKKVHQHC